MAEYSHFPLPEPSRHLFKKFAKALLAKTPYRVLRRSRVSRFHAIEDTLLSLRDRGYQPRVVVDGGAHLGTFSLACAEIFGQPRILMIEPQASCAASLKSLAGSHGFEFCPCAMADAPGKVLMTGTDAPSTGAHMLQDSRADAVEVDKVTLDSLLPGLKREDRALIKLDLQGYEMYALRGGPAVLASAEVVLTEVSFYAQAYEPTIAELVSFLDQNGFELHDVAALTARQRDNRLHQGDFLFVRKDSALAGDKRWQ